MNDTLSGKVALVAHGTSGLGQQMVLALAALGADVAFTHRAETGTADAMMARMTAQGARAGAFEIDPSKPGYADRLVSDVLMHLGRLDIVISDLSQDQAGRGSVSPGVIALHPVDIAAPLSILRAAAPVVAPHGRIVLIASVLADEGRESRALAPAVLDRAIRPLVRELAPRGVTVNLVRAGPLDLAPLDSRRDAMDRALARQCLPRLGRLEEILAPILFLVTPGASYITGATLPVDGGHSA